MQVILSNSANKFLDKQCNGDPKGIYKVRVFLAQLGSEPNPTALPNCKKMQGAKDLWWWRDRTLPHNRLRKKHRVNHRNHKNIYA